MTSVLQHIQCQNLVEVKIRTLSILLSVKNSSIILIILTNAMTLVISFVIADLLEIVILKNSTKIVNYIKKDKTNRKTKQICGE